MPPAPDCASDGAEEGRALTSRPTAFRMPLAATAAAPVETLPSWLLAVMLCAAVVMTPNIEVRMALSVVADVVDALAIRLLARLLADAMPVKRAGVSFAVSRAAVSVAVAFVA